MTGVSTEVAERLKLKTHVDVSAPAGEVADKMLDPLNIRIGNASWVANSASIAPLGLAALDRDSGDGFKTDVVIGTSLLQHFQVTIDPGARQLRLAPLGSAVVRQAEKEPLIVAGGIAVVGLGMKSQTGGGIGVPMTVDTGSRPPLLLGEGFWGAHPLPAVHGAKWSASRKLTVEAIRLGKFEMRDVPAGKPLQGSGILAVKSLGGVLGAPILNRFLVTYDLSQKAMWVSPLRGFDRPF
jgi:hypothetical protein